MLKLSLRKDQTSQKGSKCFDIVYEFMYTWQGMEQVDAVAVP
jgi:hypothetical protein